MSSNDSFKHSILEQHARKMEVLLGLCKSAIEEQVLLTFLNYFYKNSLALYDIKFLYSDYSGEPVKWEQANFPREEEQGFYIGPFRIYGVVITDVYRGLIIKCIPQHKIKILQELYTVDLAFTATIDYHKPQQTKLEFHYYVDCSGDSNSKEFYQKHRQLAMSGWTSYMYSPSEITSKEIHLAEDFISMLNKKWHEGNNHEDISS